MNSYTLNTKFWIHENGVKNIIFTNIKALIFTEIFAIFMNPGP